MFFFGILNVLWVLNFLSIVVGSLGKDSRKVGCDQVYISDRQLGIYWNWSALKQGDQ